MKNVATSDVYKACVRTITLHAKIKHQEVRHREVSQNWLRRLVRGLATFDLDD